MQCVLLSPNIIIPPPSFHAFQVDFLIIKMKYPQKLCNIQQHIERWHSAHAFIYIFQNKAPESLLKLSLWLLCVCCITIQAPLKCHKVLLCCIQRDAQCRLRSWQPVKVPSRKLLTAGDDSCFNSWADRINLNALKSKVGNTCLVF